MKIMDWRLLERNMDYEDKRGLILTVELQQKSDAFLTVRYHSWYDDDDCMWVEERLDIIDSNDYGPWVDVT